jgi:hypothetical protein
LFLSALDVVFEDIGVGVIGLVVVVKLDVLETLLIEPLGTGVGKSLS